MLMVNQLVGFGSGLKVLETVSFISSDTSLASISSPNSGDVMVVSGGWTGVPTGFTDVNIVANSNIGFAYKISDGTETSIDNLSSENTLMIFRGNVPIKTALDNDDAFQSTTGNPTPQVANAGSGTVPLIVFGFYTSFGAVDPRSFSPSKDGEVNNGNSWLAYKIYNLSPQDTTIDMDDETGIGNNVLSSFYLELA